MVFHNQLEAVERPTPRDLMGSGKISPMTIQAPGPQVEAKKKMKMAMKEICALTAEILLARESVFVGSDGSGMSWVRLNPTVTPTMATMNWQTVMARAPHTNRGRRPKRSTVQNERGVEQTLTSVKISEIRNVFSMAPVDWRKGVE